MKKFTFFVICGASGFEASAIAATEKEAHKMVWNRLDEDVKNAVESIDCIDEEAVAA